MRIDTLLDMRSDTPEGGDPDKDSPTLRKYHKLLWSKKLPSGHPFDLDDTAPGVYLHHTSDLGEFRLSSDTVVPTFGNTAKGIVSQLPEAETNAFRAIQYSIGGMMIFPGNRIDNKVTLNQARGLHPSIADRLDLTVECIRRHYSGQPNNPLGETLSRYSDFFALFLDFTGYVDFFLLQDLVTNDYSAVKFGIPFDDFKPPAIPQDVETYQEYRRLSIQFIEARNRRIDELSL